MKRANRVARRAVLLSIAWSAGATACGGDRTSETPPVEMPAFRIVNSEADLLADLPRDWRSTQRWSGGPGRTTTDTFVVASPPFAIRWESRPRGNADSAVLGAYLYDGGGRLQGVVVSRLGSGIDTAYFEVGEGRFYLLVDARKTDWSLDLMLPVEGSPEQRERGLPAGDRSGPGETEGGDRRG